MTYIEDYIEKNKSSRFTFEMLDDDVAITSGRWEGLRLSEIYVINPEYLDYIINFDRADEGLKMIAKLIKDNNERFLDSVSREISLYG